MAPRGGSRGRVVALVGAALIAAACSSTPAVTPAGSPLGSPPVTSSTGSETPAFPTVPPVDPDSIAKAATAEVDLIHAMRAELGVAAAVGADGDAALVAVDAAEQTFGEAFLPAAAADNGLDLGATSSVQLAAFTASNLYDWAGGQLGRGSTTISATLALGTEFLDRADKGIDIPGYMKEETYGSTTGDTTESVKISSTLWVKAGNGQLAVDVDQTSSATLKQNDNLVGLLNGDGKGHVDIGGCPDASGNIQGKIDVTISELWSSGGKTGTTDRKVTGTFTISANNAATLSGISAHITTAGSGTNGAGGSWTAGSTIGWGTGEPATVTSNGATQEQVNQTTGAASIVFFILANAASKAEEYWRSGKCVELKSNRESGEVNPEEEISLQIDAVSKVDGKQVKGPIAATFSGKESLDPLGQPQQAPATYQFKAGKDEGDVGTIQLQQTSVRGIGKLTLEFKVGGGLTVTASGTVNYTGFSLKLSIPTTKLVAQSSDEQGTVYTASAQVTVTGKFAFTGCTTKAVNFTSTASVTVRVNAAAPDLALVGIAPDVSMTTQKITTICDKYPATFSSGSAAIIWFGIFVGASALASVTIDSPTKLTGSGGASGTVTIARTKAT